MWGIQSIWLHKAVGSSGYLQNAESDMCFGRDEPYFRQPQFLKKKKFYY